MSKVKIQGNASGTGIFTVAAPATNTDRTLTLPDVDATVMTTVGGTFNGTNWSNATGGDVKVSNNNAVGSALTLLPTASASYSAGWSLYAGAAGAAVGDGSIGLWNHTAQTYRFSIDQNGRMKVPAQPVCLIACQGADLNWNNGDVLNHGGNGSYQSTKIVDNYSSYNLTNGRYTAPITGNYLISATANGRYYNGGVPRARIRKNGSPIGNDIHFRGNSGLSGSPGDLDQRCISLVLPLVAGDYVDFYVFENGFDTFGANYFCAYMLG